MIAVKKQVLILLTLLSLISLMFASEPLIPKVEASPDKTITYDATNNIITLVNSTEVDPFIFSDLYDADLGGTYQLLANTTISPSSETLRPNAIGDYQEWETLVDSTHYNATNDESDFTYIETVGASSKRDIQNLADPTIGTVSSVEVFVRLYVSGAGAPEKAYIMERLGSNERLTSTGSLTDGSFNDYSTGSLTTNPAGESWTIQNITDLQVGVQVQTLGNGETLRCSEIWVVITGSAFQTGLDNQVRPADSGVLKLNLVVTGFVSAGTIDLNGTDIKDDVQTESVSISGDGTYVTAKSWKTILTNGITATGSYGLEITQSRWGVVWKPTDVQFTLDARLVIGDGSTETWFVDTNKQIVFNGEIITANAQKFIEVKANAVLRFGVLDDADAKTVSQGVSYYVTDFPHFGFPWLTNIQYLIFGATDSRVYLYDSQLKCLETSDRGLIKLLGNVTNLSKIYGTSFDMVELSPIDNADIYDISIRKADVQSGVSMGLNVLENVESEDILVEFNENALYITTLFQTFKNVKARNNTVLLRTGSPGASAFLINTDADTWNFDWDYSGTVYRQYEFDLTVTYPNGTAIQNANVTLTYSGQGGGTVGSWLTDANGQVPTQTLTMGFFNQTGGNTIYNYNPYNITITKSGMQTYTKNFTLSEKTDWTIALQSQVSGSMSQGFIFGGLLAAMIMLVLGLAYFGKKS